MDGVLLTALDGNSVGLVARDEDVILEQNGDLGGGGHGVFSFDVELVKFRDDMRGDMEIKGKIPSSSTM
jgi:hypothetical protein